jgi:Txe/YoeB family toxin of Txe-Axe toxin-antitoxin module
MNNKPIYVAFASPKLEHDFEMLKEGKYEDKQLYKFIERAIDDLKKNPLCGVKIPKKLWPRGYIKKYQINNLWKYDLPDGWRLIYSIFEDKLMIINLILEWFPHKDYEKRFGY